jgi:integrase
LLPLDDNLIAVLKELKQTTGDSELLFPSPRNGSYRAAGMLMSKGINPVALKTIGCKVGWHQLRHSTRSWLDAQGVPVGIQKDLLRHADISTTMNVYGRALPKGCFQFR